MFWKKPQNSSHIKIKLPNRNQDIIIGSGLSGFITESIQKKKYSNSIMFVDENFVNLHKDFVLKIKSNLSPKDIIFINPSEKSKSLEYLNYVLGRCFKAGLNRESCIIAIGGGIVGDIAGFFASVYMRGIDLIFIPTTLMAQADTIINKVAISYKLLKNIIGSFYSPIITICDVDFLQTLSKKEISLGLSEIIKHALIDSTSFVNYLNKNLKSNLKNWKEYSWRKIIYKSLKVKSELVSKDPFDEKGYHKGLSYGHTFANAFEGLSDFNFRHGEAVALGINIVGLISKKLGFLSDKDFQRQENLLKRARLPIKFPLELKKDAIIALIKQDKICINNSITLVILKKIGQFIVYQNIDSKIVESVLDFVQ